MDINQLIVTVKKKISDSIKTENILVEDKSFLHKTHKSFKKNKFHIKLIIKSKELKEKNNIQATKIIYEILNKEIKNNIHSIQILFQ